MKHTNTISFFFITALALAQFAAGAQAIVKGSGVLYTNGAPAHSVNVNVDAELAIDTSSGLWYEYNRDASAWSAAGWRIQRLPISVAPSGAPADKQSHVVVNDVDSLYQWRAGAWRHLNGVADGSTTNELQTFNNTSNATSHTVTLSNSGGSVQLVEGAGIGLATTGTALNGVVTLTASDASNTNELQIFTNSSDATNHYLVLSDGGGSIQFAEGTGITLTTSGTSLDGILTISANGGGGNTDLSFTGSSSPVTLNSSTGTDVTFTEGGIVTLTATGTNMTISATEVDGSVTNEGTLGVGAGGATSSVITSNTSGAAGVTINAAGILTISETTSGNGGQITLTATEVDGSVTNEGTLGVGAGGATSSVITSNTSGAAGVTINAAGILTISETTSGNGGQITLTATEVDGSTTNELQTFNNTSNATSHTVTLSNSGGSVQLVEGAGIGLATTGTALDGVVTITASDPSNTNELQIFTNSSDATNHYLVLSDGGGSIQFAEGTGITLTTSGTSLDGILTISATGGGGNTDLSFTGSSSPVTLNSSTGTDVTFTEGGIVTLTATGTNMTISATEVDGSITNEGTLGVGAGGATSSVITSNTSGAAGVTINAAGILTISETTSGNGGQITLTATEVDGSITNEGTLGVGAGGATSSVITSNTSGAAGVTINAAGILTISETTSGNGGQITLTATEVDGSTTNELQTFNNTSNATSHTVTLSNSGGSVQLVEGAGIGLATTGTALDGVVTITASDPSSSNELQIFTNSADNTSHYVVLSDGGGSIQFVEGTGISLTTSGTSLDGILTISATGGGGSGDILQNGNSFGAPFIIGTNDNQTVSLEQNGVTSFTLGTDKNLTITNEVAATNTVTNRFIVQTNSTGTVANNFGTGILYQAESSTTQNRDLAALRSYWTTSTDATRTSAFGILLGRNGGPLSETLKLDYQADADGALSIGTTLPVQITNDLIWPNTETYKIGSAANLELGTWTGNVTLVRETSATAAQLDIGVEARSTGTPAAGFGPRLRFMAESSATLGRDQGAIATVWTTATDASRTADMVFSTVNNAAAPAEAMRITGAGQVQTTNSLKIGAVTGTPTTLIGRDGTGQVGTVNVGTGLSLSGGTLSATGGGGGGDILQNGNSFGAPFIIGTNDNQTVSLEQNGVTVFTIGTDKNITAVNSVAATNTVTDQLKLNMNSTGTPANNFGNAMLFSGESSTTNDQPMGRFAAYWKNATHANREAAFSWQLGDNGSALAEIMQLNREDSEGGALLIGISNPVVIQNNSITANTNFQMAMGANTFKVSRNTANTSTPNAFELESSSTGTPAAGFGARLNCTAETTTSQRDVGQIDFVWSTATDASRTSNMVFNTVNSAVVGEAFRLYGNKRAMVGGGTNEASAALQVNSTTGGFLGPKGTNAQMLAIASPVEGLEFHNTTIKGKCVYDGTNWQRLSCAQTPTVAVGSGAGTGASASVVGNDLGGVITVTAGTSPATNATVVTLTFHTEYHLKPRAVSVTAANDATGTILYSAGANRVWFCDESSVSTTQFIIKSGSAGNNAANGTTYKIFYNVSQ